VRPPVALAAFFITTADFAVLLPQGEGLDSRS
jgi:hypothetical protein